MPMMPPTLGARPAAERRADYDKARRGVKPSRRWYGLAAWAARRALQLAIEPFCQMCFQRDGAMVKASIADHVDPHREDYTAFWSGALQSLCPTCHSSVKQREERRK